jgi:hypothetical protein
METDVYRIKMLAHEAFIRRTATLDAPFMLKGSYVTRQYFENPTDRMPADLDWNYLGILSNVEDAEQTFNAWATAVTETHLEDGVKFRSFKENAFWRMIDYAMSDDFPTVNTDLLCWVDGEKFQFTMDISFNLDVEVPAIALIYKPLRGESFVVPNTVPLALQVSWKMHQTLVRPRFKDLFDLIHLLQHPDFNAQTLSDALQALVNECSVDKVDLMRYKYLIFNDLDKLYPNNSINDNWHSWRHKTDRVREFPNNLINHETANEITDASKLPVGLFHFKKLFHEALEKAGFTAISVQDLPKPMREKRKTYQ